AINNSLTAEHIVNISGILNGTTNYILTRMRNDNCDYKEALEEAMRLGYAEKDPTADVEGYDACRKIAILTSLALKKYVDFKDIHTEGITKVTVEDFKYAKQLESDIKLLGMSNIGDKVEAMVSTFLVKNTHPLYSVNDVFNAVNVRGDMLGDAMFYGAGAGKLPTASAVVADVIECLRHKDENLLMDWSDEKVSLNSFENINNSFLIRVGNGDKDNVSKVFAGAKELDEVVENETGFVVDSISEASFAEGCAKLSDVKGYIRILK
nr:homoserine dehydrogenase [Eubacterium sp.]